MHRNDLLKNLDVWFVWFDINPRGPSPILKYFSFREQKLELNLS